MISLTCRIKKKMNKQNGNRLKVTEKKLGLPDERRGVRGWAKYMKESRRYTLTAAQSQGCNV